MTSKFPGKALARFAGITVLGTLLAACAGAPQYEVPTPLPRPSAASATAPTSASAPTTPPSEREILAGIQRMVDLYSQAYNDNDVDLLMQTVDQTNAPFRRYVRTQFEDEQQCIAKARHTHAALSPFWYYMCYPNS